ncbi:MAG: hypothetical protein V4687_01065 [Bacteroidota bacterium]
MSIVLQTIEFKLLGNPYKISLWIDDEEMETLLPAFQNWSMRTEDYSDYDFAQYISSKGHFALTTSEYNHREQLSPYFERLEAGEDTESIVREIMARKNKLPEMENIINCYYEDHGQNPKHSRAKKLNFIKDNYWNFGDYLVDFPLLDS